MKKCSKCRKTKPYKAFDKHRNCISGVVSTCKVCRFKYQIKNRDRDNAQRRAAYKNDSKRRDAENRRYYEKNTPEISEYYKQYISKNRARFRHYYNAKSVEYRISKMEQTPKWLTDDQKNWMIDFYKHCPDGYEVDHILPIQGKTVKGMHVPWNLQYLPIHQNRRKSNKIEYLAKSDSQS